MNFVLDFSDEAKDGLILHKKAGNKALVKKIRIMLHDIIDHPFEGIGKPEPLKYDLANKWSRRINKEHRIVYEVIENHILIHSVYGHY